MKNLLVLALLVVGMTTFAQDGNKNIEKSNKVQFSTEQKNQLRLKKMVLELDLNASQQKEMAEIIAEQTTRYEVIKKERQANKVAGKKPTTDEKFAMINKNLDEKIAVKSRVKKILSADQFAKWDKMQNQNNKMRKAKRNNRNRNEILQNKN